MAFYENVFVVRQDTPTQRVEELAGNFSEVINSSGGKVTKTEFWGLKSLAYKIKKNRKGHFVLLNIDAPGDALKEMERAMQLSEDVIRHLSVRVEELEEGPSIIMRSRSDRDGRRDRDERYQRSENNPPTSQDSKDEGDQV